MLRNPIDATYLQVDRRSKEALSLLDRFPPEKICSHSGISLHQLRSRFRVQKLQGEVHRMDAGIPPDHIRAYEFQLQSLHGRLQKMKVSVARHESLVQEGVYIKSG